MTLAAVLVLASVAAQSATPTLIPISYEMTTHGKGPGIQTVSLTDQMTVNVMGPCENCSKVDPMTPNCVVLQAHFVNGGVIGSMDYFIDNLAAVPAGQTNVTITPSLDARFRDPSWTLYGRGGGGPIGGGALMNGIATDIKLPAGNYEILVNAWMVAGNASIFFCGCPGCAGFPGCCGGCNLGSHCGKDPGLATAGVQYKQVSATAAKSCTQTGAKSIPADDAWHLVATASCMLPPDVPQSWTCSTHPEDPGSSAVVECRMVANAANPGSGNGKFLIVKVAPPLLNLTLSVDPNDLLPSGNQNPKQGKPKGATQTAQVKAVVTANGLPVAGKKVIFTLSPTANPGHLTDSHTGNGSAAQKGLLSKSEEETDAGGTILLTYTASEAAAEVLIKARLEDDQSVKDETTVRVGVALGSIPGAGEGFVFVGQLPEHPENQGAAANLATAAVQIGGLYAVAVAEIVAELTPTQAEKVGVTLRYTDASLPRGGLFDWKTHAWTPPHSYHRFGRDMDISTRGFNLAGKQFIGGKPVEVDSKELQKVMMSVLNTATISATIFPLGGGIYDETDVKPDEGPHYHIRVLGGDTQP